MWRGTAGLHELLAPRLPSDPEQRPAYPPSNPSQPALKGSTLPSGCAFRASSSKHSARLPLPEPWQGHHDGLVAAITDNNGGREAVMPVLKPFFWQLKDKNWGSSYPFYRLLLPVSTSPVPLARPDESVVGVVGVHGGGHEAATLHGTI